MGLILRFLPTPAPRALNHAYNSLAAGMYVDMLHSYLLLAFTAMAIERVEQNRICAGKFVCLAQVLAPDFKGLFANHRAPIALHGRVVSGDELRREHTLKLVLWSYTGHSIDGRKTLLFDFVNTGILKPQC
jgi:hypothetical protein